MVLWRFQLPGLWPVNITAPNNGDVLTFDSATKLWKAAAGGGSSPHDLLDGSQNQDTVANTVARGDIIVGNSTPKWDVLAVGAARSFLTSDGTDLGYNYVIESFGYSLTDETTLPTTGVKYVTEAWPYNWTITEVASSLTTTGSGATLFTVDVLLETGLNTNSFATIFSTKPTIDAAEYTSFTAATPPALSTTAITKGMRMQLKIDTLDSGTAARGVKISFTGHQ